MQDAKYINQLKRIAHQCAKDKGFHQEKKPLTHWLTLIISELCEAVEADRNEHHFTLGDGYLISIRMCPNDDTYKAEFERNVKDTKGDELADTYIRLLDLAGLLNIELTEGVTRCHQEAFHCFTEWAYWVIKRLTNQNLPDTISDTLAEIAYYCKAHGIPLEQHIITKMRYNALRPTRNGKAY